MDVGCEEKDLITKMLTRLRILIILSILGILSILRIIKDNAAIVSKENNLQRAMAPRILRSISMYQYMRYALIRGVFCYIDLLFK